MIAVKRMSVVLNTLRSHNKIKMEDFCNEAKCMTVAKHKNIVRLLGYSHDKEPEKVQGSNDEATREVFLCSDYIPNGSLEEYIKGTQLAI